MLKGGVFILPTENSPLNRFNFKNIDINSLKVINPEDRQIIEEYNLLADDTCNIIDLIATFFYNYDALLERFQFDADHVVQRRKQLFWEKKHGIEITINALTINLISSAKTLLEFIRKSIEDTDNNERWSKSYSEVCTEWSKIISEKYDRNFNNRLSQQLRNISQHGYLPVDFRYINHTPGPKVGFIFSKLLTPKFHFNNKVRQEMEGLQDFMGQSGNNIFYSYNKLILSFCEDVIDISRLTINNLETINRKSKKKFEGLLEEKPDLFYHFEDIYSDIFFYREDENTDRPSHVFPDVIPFREMIHLKAEIEKRLNFHKQLRKNHDRKVTKITFVHSKDTDEFRITVG